MWHRQAVHGTGSRPGPTSVAPLCGAEREPFQLKQSARSLASLGSASLFECCG